MNVLALLLSLAVAVSSVLLLTRTRRDRGRRRPTDVFVHDLYEAAFLNGGPARVVDTALTALYTDGRLIIGGPGIVAVQRPEARDPVERAVLSTLADAPNGALHTLRDAVMRHPAVQEVGDGLAARGLLVSPEETRPRRRWGLIQGLSCLVAVPVSLILTFVQYAVHDGYADYPVPFFVTMLPAMLIGGVLGLLVTLTARSRITKEGLRAVHAYRSAHAYVMSPAHLVATMGLGALPDPVLQGQLLAAARFRSGNRRSASFRTASGAGAPSHSSGTSDVLAATVWCAGASPGGASCGGSTGGGGHSGGGGGGGGGCSSGTSCGSGSGSSCSSGSSCGGSSGGSSCGGSSGGSSCGSSS
ncbi:MULTISPECIES: TIGR04222 domain-containing membrane protein [unclassified Streptomyces]|uniref:TIGR04222 domain-containing membrane protein n=1 Tax=unclassified Streptomyces TaxID=2593676 RepID=UPI002DD97EE7|nr:TIGR04222 domain-containing membrane protein [Streptomyces sp. NBC_01237]WRZ75810.1 TIGR04222 domain-containing membrane protein [Streptomyces sp. NBC_01237]